MNSGVCCFSGLLDCKFISGVLSVDILFFGVLVVFVIVLLILLKCFHCLVIV